MCKSPKKIQKGRTDASKLGEHLNCSAVKQSSSPLWNGEHDSPTWDCDGLFGGNSRLDFGEFVLDPVVVLAVVVEFFEDLHCFVVAVFLDEMAGGFWEDWEGG
jgi:hypothetical protein